MNIFHAVARTAEEWQSIKEALEFYIAKRAGRGLRVGN